MAWNEVIDEVTILTLAKEDFPPVPEEAQNFSFGTEIERDLEREMLQSAFSAWERPYERRMPGCRDDSLLAMFDGDRVVCFAYMCVENEFDVPELGQGHYVVVHPDYRGKGLYNIFYARLMQHAADMGLPGIVITTDRAGLADVYERWGAKFLRKIGKADLQAEKAELQAKDAGSRSLAGRAKSRLRRLVKG
jgi:GNAT superfamily N-acetyltransferase